MISTINYVDYIGERAFQGLESLTSLGDFHIMLREVPMRMSI